MGKNIIILGMHRSGTSLITRWLKLCGLQIGNSLLGPETGNIDGHFEDNDFVHLHEELLRSENLPYTGLTSNTVEHITTKQETTIKRLIASKNASNEEWAWKDPRTCLFLKHYRKLLPEANYMVIIRGYQDVVSSLLNRDFQGLNRYYLSKGKIYRFFLRMKKKYNKNWLYKTYAQKYLEVWIAYNEELLKHIEAVPAAKVIAIDYLSLLEDDKALFNHITNYWEFSLTYIDFKMVYREQLISQSINVAAYISDAALLIKARHLENRLYSALLKPLPAAARPAQASL